LSTTGHPDKEFGTRQPLAPQPAAPAKRSGHVALLLMGTAAIGGGSYALMPSENCDPGRPGMAAPGQTGNCSAHRSSSSSGHGYSGSGSSSRASFFGGDASPGPSAGSLDAGAGHVTRGGFGSFANAFTSPFSGGG
jgi:hypothetical protein